MDDDAGLPPSLDALLGDAHPRARTFLRACQSLDADAWNRTHHLLERAKARMVRRKAKEATEKEATEKEATEKEATEGASGVTTARARL